MMSQHDNKSHRLVYPIEEVGIYYLLIYYLFYGWLLTVPKTIHITKSELVILSALIDKIY